MKGKFFFACCAAAASSVLLVGITPAQEYPFSPAKDAIEKTSRSEEDAPKRSFGGRIRERIHRGRQPDDDSQTERDDLPAKTQETSFSPPPQSESTYLKELAEWLSVPIPKDATPGDIYFSIRQVLSDSTRYPGEVLSDEAFKECKAAIPTTKDTETFEAYHAFIKKVEGKRILVLDCDNPKSND